MTIRKRLAFWYSSLLALIIIIFGVTVITVSRLTILATIDQVLNDASQELVDNISIIETTDFETAREQILFLSEEIFTAPGLSVQVWRTAYHGHTIPPELIRSSNDISEHKQALDSALFAKSQIQVESTVINHAPARVISRPFHNEQAELVGYIQMAIPLRAFEESNDQLIVITLISTLVCLLVSILVGQWLADRLLEPIKNVSQAAASIANTDDLSTRIEWHGVNDELGELTQVFNHMMQRLEHLFSVQQRFIGDISHELRTPLTSIMGNTELMQRYGMDEESLAAIHRETHRMSRMVNDLLLLTRADFGELEVDLYPIDLDILALDVYEQGAKLAHKRALSLALSRIEPVQIQGNADRLRQLMLNLFTNAIKFTPVGGKIQLEVYQQGTEAIIAVKDTGIGIAEKDLKRIFDRFYQADNSRYRTDDNDGAGLGLSIVAWIVKVHGGKIEVESEVGKGSLFRVSLPISAPDPNHKQGTAVKDSGSFKIKRRDPASSI